MRYLLFLFLLILLLGCTAQELPANGIEVHASPQNLTVRAVFNEEIRAGLQGHAEGYDQYASRILSQDFVIEEKDLERSPFSKETIFTREFEVPLVDPNVSSFILEIQTENATLRKEWGSKATATTDYASLEVLEHEKTYSIFVQIRSKSGAPVDYAGQYATVSILDKDGTLYEKSFTAKKENALNGRWNIIIDKKDVKESYYSNGTLRVLTGEPDSLKTLKAAVMVPQIPVQERKLLEEETLVQNSAIISNKTTYVGFEFILHRIGPLVRHKSEKNAKYVIAYVTVKNVLNRPQYIAKTDFYYKDSSKNFYPVSLDETGDLPGLMMPNQEVTIPFGALTLKDGETYRFYYGDRELGRTNVEFK